MGLRSRLWVLAVPAAFIIGGIVLYCIVPEKTWWMPPCLFNKLTGLYCPGCGTGRALHKLLHGDIMAALRLNVISIAAVPLILYLLADVVRCGLAGPKRRPVCLPGWIGWSIAVVVAVFWVTRNIPAFPFTLLAPH